MNRPVIRCACSMCEWYGHDDDEPSPNVDLEYEADECHDWGPELKPEDDYVNEPRSI